MILQRQQQQSRAPKQVTVSTALAHIPANEPLAVQRETRLYSSVDIDAKPGNSMAAAIALADEHKPNTSRVAQDHWFEVAKIKELNDRKAALCEQTEYRKKQALQKQYLADQMSRKNTEDQQT